MAHGYVNIRCNVRRKANIPLLAAVARGYQNSRVEYCVGNLKHRDDASRAVDGAQLIFHLAAGKSGAAADLFLDSVVASRNLLDAIAGRTPMRIVLVSSFGVYGIAGLRRNSRVTEQTALERHPEWRDHYSHAKLRQEQLFWEYQQRCGFELVVLRPGVIYGPGGGHFSSRVGLTIGNWQLNLGGSNLLPLTYVDNCAEAVVVAGANRDAAGQVYNVHDDALPTCREYLRAYKKHVKNVRSISVPYFGLQLFSRIITKYHEYSKGQVPAIFTPYKVATAWAGNHFDNSKLHSIGWKQLVSTDEGLRRSFAAYRAEMEPSDATNPSIELNVKKNQAQHLIVPTRAVVSHLRESMKLPRNAQLWLPGYLEGLTVGGAPRPARVWLLIADHFEPLRKPADEAVARNRVARWCRQWPEIARRHCDSAGNLPRYTFFYAEEEYRPHLLDGLAGMAEAGIADVEVHLHHDGEGERNFVERISSFTETLFARHGLLRKYGGKLIFGFIHGNWALDNSLPGGRWCGLNNEITLLRDLGCYADFTLPSAPSPAQTHMINTIYWANDDPVRPKSHDTGLPVRAGETSIGDLLMIPGPLALNWSSRKLGVFPRLETGELAASNPVTRQRVRLWLKYAPRVGNDVFIKLFAHGARENNASQLLERDLDLTFQLLRDECVRQGSALHYVTAWQMREAVESARSMREVVTEDRLGSTMARQNKPSYQHMGFKGSPHCVLPS